MIINRLLVLLLLYIEQLVIMNGINHLFVIIKLFYINIDIIYIQPSMNMNPQPTTLANPSSPISHGPGRLAQSGMILSCSS